jgi:hypothetical protein
MGRNDYLWPALVDALGRDIELSRGAHIDSSNS